MILGRAGISVDSGGTFTMNGGLITNNTAYHGGGVYLQGGYGGVSKGIFTMNGGEISNNTAVFGGVYSEGIFTMNGGEISGNTGDYGGGVSHSSNGDTFKIYGGKISGNTAIQGGGVQSGGKFTMSGGEISNNTARNFGGGVYLSTTSFTMSGGTISGNTVKTYDGGGVYVDDMSHLTLSGNAMIAADNNLSINQDYDRYITINMFTGSVKNITGNRYCINDGNPLIQISDDSSTAYEIRKQFVLQDRTKSLKPSADNEKHLIVTSEPALITPSPLPAGTVGEPYSQLIEATGASSLTWTYDEPSLPSDLTLEEEGERQYRISGTPTVANTYTFWINVTNDQNSCNETFTLTINDLPGPDPDPQPQPSVGPSGGSSAGDGNMENAFRVLFDAQGGSFISPATGLSYGDRVTKPADPVKDGATFAGWYKDAGHTQPWDFADGIPGDMTLYAKWTGGSSAATTQPTTAATTAATGTVTQIPVTAATTTTPVATTATEPRRTLVQTPAPVFGVLAGFLAAGVLLRRKT